MKDPQFYVLDLLRPHYMKGFQFFRNKDEALKYKDEEELKYRRIKFSEPIPLYTDNVPDGYMLVKKQPLIRRLLSFRICAII